MMRNDLTLWPLVVSVSRGVPTLQELQTHSADWEGWLDRGERFATLRLYADVAAHSYPDGGAKEKKRWFQANGARVKTLVVGMASVVPSEILEKVGRTNNENLFGVPVQAFADTVPAAQWIGALLQAQGLDVSLEKASATLKRLMV